MVGHGWSSAGSYLTDPTSPIPSHGAVINNNVVHLSCLKLSQVVHQLPWLALLRVKIAQEFVRVVSKRSHEWHKMQPSCSVTITEDSLGSNKFVFVLCCFTSWHLVSIRTFSVMHDHTSLYTYSTLANHQLRHQARSKMDYLSAWWLQMATLIFLRVCVDTCMYGLTCSLYHPWRRLI